MHYLQGITNLGLGEFDKALLLFEELEKKENECKLVSGRIANNIYIIKQWSSGTKRLLQLHGSANKEFLNALNKCTFIKKSLLNTYNLEDINTFHATFFSEALI